MLKGMEPPQISISYSWSSQEHENWVIELANRLMNDGVLVVIDKLNLKEGQDKYKFMEIIVEDCFTSFAMTSLLCDNINSEASCLQGGASRNLIYYLLDTCLLTLLTKRGLRGMKPVNYNLE